MIKYILTSNEEKPGCYLARRYIDKYRVIDYIAPLYCVFGGKLTASQAIIFDSVEEAQKYLQRNSYCNTDSNTWKITRYNVCCNCVEA